jgi:hypothetical protein
MTKRKQEKTFETFEEWVRDDEEWAAFLRKAERQGLIESFMGDDGQVLYEVTGKQPKPGDGGTGELDS